MNQECRPHVARAAPHSRLNSWRSTTSICSGNATGSCDVTRIGNISGYNWLLQTRAAKLGPVTPINQSTLTLIKAPILYVWNTYMLTY